MEIAIQIPEDVARLLKAKWDDLPRRTLEAIAADAYREGVITAAEVGRLLQHTSRFETESFLKENEVYLDYTDNDLQEDIETLRGMEAP